MTSLATPSETQRPQEIQKFDALSCHWWDEKGPFSQLHRMNPCRLSFIREQCIQHFQLDSSTLLPLSGLRILDVGCGGGLVTEPLARLGGAVVGLDGSPEAIQVAREHALREGLAIDYHEGFLETFSHESFHIITAIELVEHVDHVDVFIEALLKRLKPGGLAFISTLNQNLKSYGEAIIAAEYLFKWAPPGTHDWKRFFKPHKLIELLESLGGEVIAINGMRYTFFTQTWARVPVPQTNYILSFKNK
jgi:2-polyprenyl-6-hydroxyphenyl methylase/3-demethylubiquinone-9 3-methyltransferase